MTTSTKPHQGYVGASLNPQNEDYPMLSEITTAKIHKEHTHHNWLTCGSWCGQAVAIFQALVVQVRKSANLALAATNAIAGASICPDLTPILEGTWSGGQDVPTLQGLCDDIELHYTQVWLRAHAHMRCARHAHRPMQLHTPPYVSMNVFAGGTHVCICAHIHAHACMHTQTHVRSHSPT